MLARGGNVLGRDTDARAALHRAGPVESAFGRHDHPAARDLEVERLVEPVAAMLLQHVLAGDTGIGRTVLHIRRHVGRSDDDDRHPGNVRA